MTEALPAMEIDAPCGPRLHLRYDMAIDPDSDSTHAKVLKLVGAGKRVLELGCATGSMTRVLRDRGCRVVAVELDAEMASRAEPYCERMILGDLDQMDLVAELGKEEFDVVVAADVLEHLKDPLAVLNAVKKHLGPGGYIVLSVPNVAHGSVRLALLQGRFRYTDLGLLDRTHLRFFTRETIVQLLRDAGFAVGHLECQELMIDRGEVMFDATELPPQVLENLSQDLEARTYQFILAAYPLPWRGMEWLHQRFLEWAEQEQALQRELVGTRELTVHKVQAATQETSEVRERAARQVAEANEAALRQLSAAKDAWQMDKECLLTQIERLTADISSACQAVDEKERIIHDLAVDKAGLLAEVQDLNRLINDCRENAKDELTRANETYATQLHQARDIARGELEAAVSECRLQADKEKEELLARFEIIALREKELRTNLLETHDQLLRRDSEFDSLLRDINAQRDQMAADQVELSGQLNHVAEELACRTSERDQLLADHHDLERRLAERDTELGRMTIDYGRLIEEHNVVLGNLDRLESRLAQFRSSLPGRLYFRMRKIYRGLRGLPGLVRNE
jgi:2-polyprenyl-3-methyl-5-hydroxy-6-metoxy-1,4-benzoquinol methylase